MDQLGRRRAPSAVRSGRRLKPPPGGVPHRRRAPPPRPEAAGDGVRGEEDRISSLPDDLLIDVLGRLGCTRQAARTSVLARRWCGLWTRLPELSFRGVPLDSLMALLDEVTGPALMKLNLLDFSVKLKRDEAACPKHVTSLLRAAERLAPKNLAIRLSFDYVTPAGGAIQLPCFEWAASLTLHVERCSSLVKLVFPPAGEFTALKTLVLSSTSSNIEPGALLPLCPSLRSLRFCVPKGFDELTVHSASLEKLVVDGSQYCENTISRIDIMAPLLKEARLCFYRGDNFSFSLSAPMLEELTWSVYYFNDFIGIQVMRLWTMDYSLSHGVHELSLDMKFEDESAGWVWDWSIEEEMEGLPFLQYSVLTLNLQVGHHAFGPLVLHLLQIRPVRTLKVSCPLYDCSCEQHTNWRDARVSLTDLEVVKLDGFGGGDDEADFLKLLFRCASVLKSLTMEVSDEGYKKICSICKLYPDVECDVSVRR